MENKSKGSKSGGGRQEQKRLFNGKTVRKEWNRLKLEINYDEKTKRVLTADRSSFSFSKM
jgi:hypothetical protein